MIQYSLKCTEGHGFDSWFQSAAAFDKLRDAGMVACAICGTTKVEKELMAPSLGRTRGDAGRGHAEDEGRGADRPRGPLSQPASPAEQALARLRKHVEQNSDYVGDRFVHEARAIHAGEAPERPIHGEARAADARALIEEGVPVAPLPFTPRTKSN